MVFWTIVFFAVSLYGLFKGGMFSSTTKKLMEIELKKAEGEDEDIVNVEMLKTGLLPLMIALVMIMIEIIYLVKALNYDPHKFPTIIAMLLIILAFALSKKEKKKKTTELTSDELLIAKMKVIDYKAVTFKTVIKSILWTVYFGYMFYVLVF